MKKVFAIFILAIFVLSIAGCAGEKPAPAAPATPGAEDNEAAPTPGVEETAPEPVACTMDAKVCPDGSAVGRMAPDCEFAPCPEVEVSDPDYFKMGASEFGDAVEVKNADVTSEGNTATLNYVRVVIRNYNVDNLKPRIVVQLIGENEINEVKEFQLDMLPKGYMMRKDLQMDGMNIPEAKLMKVISVSLVDENQALKEIAKGKMEFIPIPAN